MDKAFIAAIMIVGAKAEPFLSASLESIRDAVDLLVLNDNSGEQSSPNRSTISRSSLYADGRVHIIPSEFKGFGYCRTLCLDYLREHHPRNTWVLYIDADEVHPPSISHLTRNIIAELPQCVGIVDGYFYQFFLSHRYYLSLDRRHNLFFRFNKDVRWEGKVHEKPVNLRGCREAFPYRYFHYGYLTNPRDILSKWSLYADLGDGGCNDVTVNPSFYFKKDASRVMRFQGAHPPAARPALERVLSENGEHFEHFEALVKELEGVNRLRRKMRHINFELRTALRGLECAIKFFYRRGFLRSLGELRKLDTDWSNDSAC